MKENIILFVIGLPIVLLCSMFVFLLFLLSEIVLAILFFIALMSALIYLTWIMGDVYNDTKTVKKIRSKLNI